MKTNLFDREIKKIRRQTLSPNRRKRLSRLYPECRPEEKAAEQDAKRLWMAAIALAAGSVLTVAALLVGGASEIQMLERPAPGAGSRTEVLQVQQGDHVATVDLELAERRLTEEERETRLDQAEAEMCILFLGENPDVEHVSLPLNLSAECPVDGVTAWWNPEETELVHPDGTIAEETVFGADGRTTVLELNLKDGETERVVPVTVSLRDRENPESGKEASAERALQKLVEENPEETEVLLPGEIDGQPVTYRRDGDLPAGIFLILGLLAAGVFLFYPEQRMREEEKKREEELALAYSEFVAKIRVLTGAGLSLRSTWKRLAEEYEADRAKGGKRKILYEEVCRTERELSQGVLEEEVYSRFAGRIGQGAYLRLGGLLESHIRNGIRGFSALLAAESAEAFRERLQLARRQGEQISARLLIPLLLLFALILVLLMVPAFFSL